MQILFVDYTQVGLFALTLCSDLDTQLITSEPLPGIRIVSLKLKQLCAVVKHEEVPLGEGRPFERHHTHEALSLIPFDLSTTD
jgi:hypothetical protein